MTRSRTQLAHVASAPSLQQRVQALYERVLAESGDRRNADPRLLDLRLRVTEIVRPPIPVEAPRPTSDVTVIN